MKSDKSGTNMSDTDKYLDGIITKRKKQKITQHNL